MTALANILKQIPTLTDQELRMLNNAIVGQIRHAANLKQIAAGSKFGIGQNVKFTDKRGRTVVISIEKINAKSIKGVELTPDGRIERFAQRWTVSPSLCSAI